MIRIIEISRKQRHSNLYISTYAPKLCLPTWNCYWWRVIVDRKEDVKTILHLQTKPDVVQNRGIDFVASRFLSSGCVDLALCRVYTGIHVSDYKLYPLVAYLVAVYMYLQSCIGDKTVARLSPVCCWIQRDTSRPWHKWIVIMSPRYSLQVSRTSNLYPSTFICIRIQVARLG